MYKVLCVVLVILILFCIFREKKSEGLSGFGVISSLSLYNRDANCEEGRGHWSGGCFLPHRVII